MDSEDLGGRVQALLSMDFCVRGVVKCEWGGCLSDRPLGQMQTVIYNTSESTLPKAKISCILTGETAFRRQELGIKLPLVRGRRLHIIDQLSDIPNMSYSTVSMDSCVSDVVKCEWGGCLSDRPLGQIRTVRTTSESTLPKAKILGLKSCVF